ncbi:MAG: LysR family transcriptional regulator [Rhodobacteraceae bacterium]|nr:LysR family transcriptional regulator [Paracoccaceae bacterium]MAY45539.1 LysR family transcriptional regulator [Paracoccaceae bacterium]
MLKGVTLRGLEVFEALAAHGSVAAAAEATGLSQPAVSQQLTNLEKALGTTLVERARRPMRLTRAGRGFLARTENALRELRIAQSELSVMDLSDLPALDIGLIDDFDNDLTPRLVTVLADSLTRCRFKLITAPSREISQAMIDGVFHIAVAASSGEVLDGVVEYPLVRDPFVAVAPRDRVSDADQLLEDLADLPFLRYAGDQLIARQIEALLSRHGLAFEERFEIGSHPALMAMVARSIGWAITTPLGYMRATRFHDDLSCFPLPFSGAARTISLFARSDFTSTVPLDVAQTMRRLVQGHMIDPAVGRLPWLGGELKVIEA